MSNYVEVPTTIFCDIKAGQIFHTASGPGNFCMKLVFDAGIQPPVNYVELESGSLGYMKDDIEIFVHRKVKITCN